MSLLLPPQRPSLKRRAYTAMLATGLVGLLGLVLVDADGSLKAPESAQVWRRSDLQALTSGTAVDGFGSWSPDGRQIAFMRDGQIWLISAEGQQPRALTQNDVWNTVPVWRPGGKEIAFIRLDMQGGSARLILMNPSTGKETELLAETGPMGFVAWAPSGKALYYTTPRRLIRYDLTSKEQKLMLEVASDWEMMGGGLSISPNGKWAVFGAGPRVGQSIQYDLWIAPLDGSAAQPEQLTRDGGIMPAFSPDGKRIAYRNPRKETGIYLMDLAKRTTSRIVPDERGAMYFHPRFSPDGTTLLLSRLILNPERGQGRGGAFTSHLYLHRLAAAGGDQ